VTAAWRVVPGQTLQHRIWDDECVLYNSLSGDTHLIEASALHVLLALQPEPLSNKALSAALSAALALDPEEAAVIPALLEDLKLLALVEEIEC
jgi:PqqD family protein of HPr-rel-A system